MVERVIRRLATAAIVGLLGCAAFPPLATAPSVDLQRYAGTWYEIASFPNRFQRGCVATRATYTPRPDGTIGVRNECRRGTLDAPPDVIHGKAWVVDPATRSRLQVQFFWPFRGAYDIIYVDPDYRTALVGHPSRDYLWILSRTPELDDPTYQALVTLAATRGFDVARLQRTPQRP
jgi:apolipoprotein D and lipocalin family protein